MAEVGLCMSVGVAAAAAVVVVVVTRPVVASEALHPGPNARCCMPWHAPFPRPPPVLPTPFSPKQPRRCATKDACRCRP